MRMDPGEVENASQPLTEGAGHTVRLFSSHFQTLSERKISEGMSRPRLGARSTRSIRHLVGAGLPSFTGGGMMARYHVEFDVDIVGEYSREDILAWIRFELHTRGGLPLSCPLAERDLDAVGGSVCVSEQSGFDPARAGGDRGVTVVQVRRGNVVLEKVTGNKRCVHEDEKLNADEWELVCQSPHADGDYSYLCNNQWCRCQQ